MKSARELLVDSHHGVYAWHNLVTRYPLFVGMDRVSLADYLAANMPEETLETVFYPYNDNWCDNIDFIGNISVQAGDESYWMIEQDDDIWAINPKAEWSDDEQGYVLPS